MQDGYLWCDADMVGRSGVGTTIGMDKIKQRRLRQSLQSHAGLTVGECVPFYFCTRSVMLHSIHSRDDADLAYRGGQESVVHLRLDMREAIAWAESERHCWAFTTSNAGAEGFADYGDLAFLDRIDWNIVLDPDWIRSRRDKTFEEAKAARQAEFLVEMKVAWPLVQFIGVYSHDVRERVLEVFEGAEHTPEVVVRRTWYY